MLKFVLFVILAYLLGRAVLNLTRAMRREGGRGGGPPPNGARRSAPGERRRSQQQTRRGTRATRLREEEDVEDATWEDV